MLVLAVLGLALAGGAAAAVTAQPDFDDQLREVERSFPLVARALDYLQKLPTFCQVDPVCFDRLQQNCLARLGRRAARLCFETSRDACCKPPVVVDPGLVVDAGPSIRSGSGVVVVDPGRSGTGSGECRDPKPADIGCSRICKPCITFVCVDGDWQRLEIDFPDELCNPRGPTDPPLTTCKRTAEDFCPAECHVCF